MGSRWVMLAAPCTGNLITVVMYVYSLKKDVWLSELSVSQHKEMLSRLGLWYSCWKKSHFCVDTVKMIYYDLSDVTGGDTIWLMAIQFLAVTATILKSFGVLNVLIDIIYENQNISSRSRLQFVVGMVNMMLGLSYFYYTIKMKFKQSRYRWGVSFTLVCVGTVFSFTVNFIHMVVTRRKSGCDGNCLILSNSEMVHDHA